MTLNERIAWHQAQLRAADTGPLVTAYVDAGGRLYCAPCAIRLDISRQSPVWSNNSAMNDEPCERCGAIVSAHVHPVYLSPFTRRALRGELPAKVTR